MKFDKIFKTELLIVFFSPRAIIDTCRAVAIGLQNSLHLLKDCFETSIETTFSEYKKYGSNSLTIKFHEEITTSRDDLNEKL